jgi:23S rRNA pseudouridine955/2504/2580 synthase
MTGAGAEEPGAAGGVALVTVAAGEDGLRLDRWFRQHYPEVPHARLERWLRLGHVRVDGRRARAADRLVPGQVVRVPPRGTAHPPSSPSPPPLLDAGLVAELRGRVLHLDADLLVLDKPAGLAVQGGSRVTRHLDQMLDALAFDGERPRLVHRLDRDTSGVLVLARTQAAARQLTAAFRGKAVEKLYWAVVAGVPSPAEGRISLPLRKAAGGTGERMIADRDGGLPAITLYRVVDRAGRRASWLAMQPLTGRTHQLRVHAAEALTTPILGDGKYGGAAAFLGDAEIARSLNLHARAVRLPRPDGGTLEVTAPLPPHLAASFRFLGFDPAHPAATTAAWAPPAAAAVRPRRSSPRRPPLAGGRG